MLSLKSRKTKHLEYLYDRTHEIHEEVRASVFKGARDNHIPVAKIKRQVAYMDRIRRRIKLLKS